MADPQQMLRHKILTVLFPPLSRVMTVDVNLEPTSRATNDNLHDDSSPPPNFRLKAVPPLHPSRCCQPVLEAKPSN